MTSLPSQLASSFFHYNLSVPHRQRNTLRAINHLIYSCLHTVHVLTILPFLFIEALQSWYDMYRAVWRSLVRFPFRYRTQDIGYFACLLSCKLPFCLSYIYLSIHAHVPSGLSNVFRPHILQTARSILLFCKIPPLKRPHSNEHRNRSD